ncbi:MAG: hypothetical protein NWE87_00445 [Candidatus Bathyarchaeota archaeon]|nr:hypothetical protein [Candidatus Bathyarchaeota archaeon]
MSTYGSIEKNKIPIKKFTSSQPLMSQSIYVFVGKRGPLLRSYGLGVVSTSQCGDRYDTFPTSTPQPTSTYLLFLFSPI